MNYSDERNEVGELEKMKLALIDLSERLESLEKVQNSHFYSVFSIFITIFDWTSLLI
jgi:hypothetical protein